MKFYVASSFRNIDKVRYVSDQLKRKGFVQTYDWTVHEGVSTFEQLGEIGRQEKDAVAGADMVVVLLPAGKGSHIELGIALGLGKKLYLHSPDGEVNHMEATCTFYHLDEVDRFIGTADELIDYISSAAGL